MEQTDDSPYALNAQERGVLTVLEQQLTQHKE